MKYATRIIHYIIMMYCLFKGAEIYVIMALLSLIVAELVRLNDDTKTM